MKNALSVNDSGSALSAKDINVSLAGRKILHAISLDVPSSSMVGILGPNGSGKTTLLRALAGIISVTSGDVMLGDKSLPQWKRGELSQKIAYVPQLSTPPSGFLVRELVLLGRFPYRTLWGGESKRDNAVVDGVIEQVGLSDLADRDVMELSGGEYRRTVIARALAQEAEILILDEPTAHLDIRHQMEVLTTLHDLSSRHSVIVTFHDINQAARFCQNLIFLKEGSVLTQGPTGQILTPDNIARTFDIADPIGRIS